MRSLVIKPLTFYPPDEVGDIEIDQDVEYPIFGLQIPFNELYEWMETIKKRCKMPKNPWSPEPTEYEIEKTKAEKLEIIAENCPWYDYNIATCDATKHLCDIEHCAPRYFSNLKEKL